MDRREQHAQGRRRARCSRRVDAQSEATRLLHRMPPRTGRHRGNFTRQARGAHSTARSARTATACRSGTRRARGFGGRGAPVNAWTANSVTRYTIFLFWRSYYRWTMIYPHLRGSIPEAVGIGLAVIHLNGLFFCAQGDWSVGVTDADRRRLMRAKRALKPRSGMRPEPNTASEA